MAWARSLCYLWESGSQKARPLTLAAAHERAPLNLVSLSHSSPPLSLLLCLALVEQWNVISFDSLSLSSPVHVTSCWEQQPAIGNADRHGLSRPLRTADSVTDGRERIAKRLPPLHPYAPQYPVKLRWVKIPGGDSPERRLARPWRCCVTNSHEITCVMHFGQGTKSARGWVTDETFFRFPLVFFCFAKDSK